MYYALYGSTAKTNRTIRYMPVSSRLAPEKLRTLGGFSFLPLTYLLCRVTINTVIRQPP